MNDALPPFSFMWKICLYVRTSNANLKHFPPSGINSIVTQQTNPKHPRINANGNLMNSQIAADSNAPVMWKPSQNSSASTANTIIISTICVPPLSVLLFYSSPGQNIDLLIMGIG